MRVPFDVDDLILLTEREEKILCLRYGLSDGYQRTLEEVGSVFGVTRERIRQIEFKALQKIKKKSREGNNEGSSLSHV